MPIQSYGSAADPRPSVSVLLLVIALLSPQLAAGQANTASPLPVVRANDNRVAAGRLSEGTFDIVITARVGQWFPDGERRPAPLVVPAFGEGDEVPTVPGPMIRVRSGTRVRVTVRNALDDRVAGAPLIVHGLYGRPAEHGDTVHVAPGGSRVVSFEAGAPGTYYYWATLSDTAAIDARNGIDSQLGGAIIVDPAEGPVAPDRVFILGRMELPAEEEGPMRQPERFVITINGLSWPRTERLTATVGDTVRWRWINPTDSHHPMHLHGFFYRVDAVGNERADTLYAPAGRRMVVTERMIEGGTMTMVWVPERAGNWLIHCHLKAHSGPDNGWGFPDVPGTGAFGSAFVNETAVHRHDPVGHDMDRDMAGMVLGVHVRPSPQYIQRSPDAGSARHRIQLTVLRHLLPAGADPLVASRVEDLGPERPGTLESAGVGPPIVLRRDVPAAIRVVNHLDEPTALHWHGIELESYFDGVPGWSGGPGGGAGDRISPVIMPSDSFTALMTPPHAGTFIYHSHSMMTTQVGDGLYGPLIVLDPEEEYDPSREILWIVGGRERDESERAFLYLNGERHPPPLSLVAGRTYRVRIINITESNTADVALLRESGAEPMPVEWRPLAKDAAPVTAAGSTRQPALLRTSVGETFDFELVVSDPGPLRFEVRNGGDLMVQQRIVVR